MLEVNTMSTLAKPVPPSAEKTEHPHIVRVQGIGGGEPIVKGTRISVRLIAEYYKAGMLAEEIRRDYPHLNLAAIYDAISYYIDHQTEIEALIEANQIDAVLKNAGLVMAESGVILSKNETRNQ